MHLLPLTVRFDGASETLLVSGEFADGSPEVLREAIEEHSMGHVGDLTVDLSEVTYLPSIALGVLMLAMGASRRAGATMRVTAAPHTIAARVLQVAGIPSSSDALKLPGEQEETSA